MKKALIAAIIIFIAGFSIPSEGEKTNGVKIIVIPGQNNYCNSQAGAFDARYGDRTITVRFELKTIQIFQDGKAISHADEVLCPSMPRPNRTPITGRTVNVVGRWGDTIVFNAEQISM